MDFQIGFTDKEITPLGGMALMKRMMDPCDIDEVISSLVLPVQGSNCGYKAKDARLGRPNILVRAVQRSQDGNGQAADSGQVQGDGETVEAFQNSDMYNRYRYHCFITDLTLPAQQVRNLYKQRADAENRIKELKYDFGFDSFSLNSFYGTEAALSMVMLAYNLMSLFRQSILGVHVQRKLSTLRYRLFAMGGYMVKEGNHRILKLSLAMKRRAWFLGLWDKTSLFSLSTKLVTETPIA